MDPITFLQVTHVEQRIAREAAAAHNLAARERRQRAGGRLRSPLAHFAIRRTRVRTTACATC